MADRPRPLRAIAAGLSVIGAVATALVSSGVFDAGPEVPTYRVVLAALAVVLSVVGVPVFGESQVTPVSDPRGSDGITRLIPDPSGNVPFDARGMQ